MNLKNYSENIKNKLKEGKNDRYNKYIYINVFYLWVCWMSYGIYNNFFAWKFNRKLEMIITEAKQNSWITLENNQISFI